MAITELGYKCSICFSSHVSHSAQNKIKRKCHFLHYSPNYVGFGLCIRLDLSSLKNTAKIYSVIYFFVSLELSLLQQSCFQCYCIYKAFVHSSWVYYSLVDIHHSRVKPLKIVMCIRSCFMSCPKILQKCTFFLTAYLFHQFL